MSIDSALQVRARALSPVSRISTDTALMTCVAAGDKTAFAILIERHSPALYRLACRMLNDRHEAEDIVQECFARLWQRAGSWRPAASGLVGWLYRVTVNLCLERHRRLRLIDEGNVREPIDDAPLPDAVMEADQTRNAIALALADLPERYRSALKLCYTDGLTNALAAEAMHLNVKAMESLLFRARKQLRVLLTARLSREQPAGHAERAASPW